MKPLTPVKTIALAALAATVVLPAAQALPVAEAFPAEKAHASKPVANVSAVSASASLAPASAPSSAGAIPVSLSVDRMAVRDVLATMFKQQHLDYTIDQNVDGTVSVHLNSVPADKALVTVLEASDQPLSYTVQNSVYHIHVRPNLTIAAGPGTPFPVPDPLVSVDLKKIPIRQALDSLFAAAKANYTLAPGVPGDSDVVTTHLTNVPLDQALDAVLAASETPLGYTVQRGGIFVVTPKHRSVVAF
jgi:type II secretory pathway component HofQ